MKLMKLLILALGLLALTAAVASAQDIDILNVPFNASGGSPRIIATNSQTGETATVIFTALAGNSEDPRYLPGSPDPQQVKESIYMNYDHTISALSDIRIIMQLPGPNAAMVSPPFTAYGQWKLINNGTADIAQARVGVTAGVPSGLLQIQFLQDTSFWEGSTIEVSGVRVDLAGAPSGEEVMVDFSTAEGSAAISPDQLLVARSTDPLTCVEPCTPTIDFASDGQRYNDVATLTIRELFNNAYEEPSQIQVYISNIPTGFAFDGISGLTTTGNVIASVSSCSSTPTTTSATCLITITDQNPGIIEDIKVGLRWDLVGIPDFSPNQASVRITLYPPGPPDSMPYNITYPGEVHHYLRYSALYSTCHVNFAVEEKAGGKLLSVFNTLYPVEGWDTGFGIMNGSGAATLDEYRDWWGHWWDIPQYGTITVYFYPQDTAVSDNPASPYIYTTEAGSPGLGLDAFGRVPPKGEWTVLLSEILPLARNGDNEAHVGNFSGFIVFETNFPLAEGINYVTDWVDTANGYPMINLSLREEEGRRSFDVR